MNRIYTLLEEEQLTSEKKVKITDFAVISGASRSEDGYGEWFLATAAGYGDIFIVTEEGAIKRGYATSVGGVRPAFELESTGSISYGEYPQFAVSKDFANTLEQEYRKARLIKTGKTYNGHIVEYQYEDKKYVRAEYTAKESQVLSNGKKYKPEDMVWLEVDSVKWKQDANSGLMVSTLILAGGVQFLNNNVYDGNFKDTSIYRFLNETFAEDLEPSKLHEMTEEERAQYEADIKRAEERRNPYNLTFGDVSEEDIIRGAIESDVAVFLHGPSSEGKSARVKQIDPTCEILYLRNATPDSLNGRSVYNQANGEMIDIPPTWYRKLKDKCEAEPDKFHVIFFDEINNALPSIQGMAFNIVLDREVNGIWKLPPNARVVAAGNDMQDSLAANQIAAPFFNRFAHVYINTTTEKWLKWAREHNIHPAIYSYIAYKNGETLRSPYDGVKPNADPRKWEMASRMLYATGQPEMLRALIGEDITDEFVRFCKQPVMTLDDIIAGNYSDRDIQDMNTAEKYATVLGLTMASKDEAAEARAFAVKLGEEFRALFDAYVVADK